MESENENRIFFTRVGQLPVIKAAYEKTYDVYEATKNSNRLFNATLNMVENSVKFASEMEAVKKVLNNSITTTANGIAVDQLEKLEEKYPSIKKTPDELWSDSKNYYENSRVKNSVDKIVSAKEYGVSKVDDTKKYCEKLIAGDYTVIELIQECSRYGLLIMNEVLDRSDNFINKYVAVDEQGNPPQQSGSDDLTSMDRVQLMSGKVYHGLKYRTVAKYGETKDILLKTLGDLQMAMLLMEYAKNTANWASEKAVGTLTVAQEQAKSLWHEIQQKTEPVGKKSEIILLNVVQSWASVVASLSDQILKLSSPYLPESAEKKVAIAANYAHELRDNFAKAKSLGDLKNEVIAEAKDKLGYVQEGLVNAFDYLADLPPVSWLVPSQTSDSTSFASDPSELTISRSTYSSRSSDESGLALMNDEILKENFYGF